MSCRLNEFIHRECSEQCLAPGKHSANNHHYLVNTVALPVFASTMKGQLGQQIFIYLWSLLKQMTSCMVWAHPRGRHFNRTLDIFTINFMWRSQRKPFITHNIWLNKGSTERGHCVKIKNKLLFQVLKFWMSVWPKQIKEAVEKERLEEREQSTNWGKEEIREVSFLIGQNWAYHIPFILNFPRKSNLNSQLNSTILPK